MDRDVEKVARLAPSWRLVYLAFLFAIGILVAWIASELSRGVQTQEKFVASSAEGRAVQDSIAAGVVLVREAIDRGEQNSQEIASGVYVILQRLDVLEQRARRERRVQSRDIVASVQRVEAKVDTVAAAVDTVSAVVDSVKTTVDSVKIAVPRTAPAAPAPRRR